VNAFHHMVQLCVTKSGAGQDGCTGPVTPREREAGQREGAPSCLAA
jgi:hypothetical protein